MNIIRMTGGLGNQMFQYALYLKYLNIGREAMFEDWTEYEGRDNRRPIQLNVFDIEYPVADIETYNEYTDSDVHFTSKIRRKLFGRKSREYAEASADFDVKILEQDNSYITGYFQSEKYFEDIKEKVLEEFTFSDWVKTQSIELLNGILEDKIAEGKDFAGLGAFRRDMLLSCDPKSSALFKDNVVSIHIRRGDYLNLPDTYGNICTEDFYDRAVRYILDQNKDSVFLIFSNDTEWAKEWSSSYLKENIPMLVIFGTSEDNGYIDMFLMSQCHHHIIANSSFSWWGAYLGNRNYPNDSIIVAPNCWNNKTKQEDIYTKDMIRL